MAEDASRARARMVELHLKRRGIRSAAVIAAMESVPREDFVEPGLAEFAYEDAPLPIGEGQTISQPFMVAYMIEAAEVKPGDRVLEIGAGSGYAAAVASRIAERIYTIERLPSLGEAARDRLEQLGYANVELRVGDGTRGWAEAAPFDAILVAAGAPVAPEALKNQLAVGGRLIVPVGETSEIQRLRRITRAGPESFEEDDLGGVRFVPLIGENAWNEDGSRPAAPAEAEPSLPSAIAGSAEALPDPDDLDFAAAFDRFANHRVVLLGEASHGTAEFYRARAAITRRLIERHGFTIVAVEADWPDAAAINRHVCHRPEPRDAAPPFQRFPTWMWRNAEIASLVAWMRDWNAERPPEGQAGFYGLDMYNMSGSIAAVLAYLDRVDPDAATVARERYGCLTPWQKEPSTYGRAVLRGGYSKCEAEVVRQCRDLLEKRLDYAGEGGDEFLDAAQNARLVTAAERYYRIMYYGGPESWNLRDTHMFETLEHLLASRGPEAKAIVWAHNSHIGDARHTEMGWSRDELNIGQLCRERFGEDAALIGFGTHGGTVAAATDWGGAMEVKDVRPSHAGSYERLCHESGVSRFLLDLRPGENEALRRRLMEPKLERFIGVIYRPETELQSHYAEARLPQQFDAYVWFNETSAITPLPGKNTITGVPDTYPSGL